MLRAITHKVSPRIAECELTYADRLPIDVELAARQHDDYSAALARLGAQVTTLSENESYPDSCFVEDTAIVVDELAVICEHGRSVEAGRDKAYRARAIEIPGAHFTSLCPPPSKAGMCCG